MLPELDFVICHMWMQRRLRTGQHQSDLVYAFSLSSFRDGGGGQTWEGWKSECDWGTLCDISN